MSEQSLKDKTAKGLFWGGLSNGFQQLLSLIFGIVLARILNASDYGMVGMLAIFSAITSALQESGFTTALINRKDIKDEDYNAVFWFSTFLGVFFYVILFFLAPTIALFYEKPQLVFLSRIVFLGFLVGGLGTASNGYMFKTLMVKERAKVDIISLFISGVVGMVLAVKGFAYVGLAIQSVIYSGMNALLKLYYSPWKPSLSINFHPLKQMLRFSYKLLLTTIFIQINNNILSVILGKFYSPAQLGFYGQGQKWTTMGNQLIAGTINSVAQPVLVNVSDEKDRLLNVFRKMVRFGAFISLPVMLGIGFVSNEFIYICLGEKWLPSVPFLQLFCLWGAFGFLCTMYTTLLISHGQSRIYMNGMILTGLFQLLIVFIMYKFGIMMMVMSYISVNFVSLFYWHYFSKRIIDLKFSNILKDIFPFLTILAFSFVVTFFIVKGVQNIYLKFVSKILIVSILYVFIMWISDAKILKESVRYIKGKL